MDIVIKCAVLFVYLILSANSLQFDDKVEEKYVEQQQQQQQQNFSEPQIEGRQSARHLLDFIGLGTGNNIDPYLRKTNENCLKGELSECFKSQALNSVDEIFYRDAYV